jgi:hypothetical protein
MSVEGMMRIEERGMMRRVGGYWFAFAFCWIRGDGGEKERGRKG